MERIGFIGSYDKTDLMLYVAKLLVTIGKKVLIIDNTLMQKARYIVPVISPTKAYVTEFENIDVSVGFDNYQDIKRYLGISEEKELDYDFVFIDVDNVTNFQNFNVSTCKINYFVTSFDLYSLKRGLEILKGIQEPIRLTKILYAKEILKEDDDYLNFISLGTKVVWNEQYRVYMPFDSGDQSIINENQRVSKIGVRRLSSQYKDGLYYIAVDILGDTLEPEVRKALKILEKEV